MQYILQVFTGNFLSSKHSPEEIISVLKETIRKIPTKGVIIGWSSDKELYESILSFLHSQNIKVWLWMPVFSDLHPDIPRQPAVDLLGNTPEGISVMAEEDFSFVCPSHPQNINAPLLTFEKYFEGLAFDGIFLDKIRSASFSSNFVDSLGCFCSSCKEIYESRGVNVKELRELYEKQSTLFIPAARKDSRYCYKNSTIDTFYKVRGEIISQAVVTLSENFQKKALDIALDVYTPLFAYLVGQDIKALGEVSDFIKPMIYRITHAPAGIPFEYQGLLNFFQEKDSIFEEHFLSLWNAQSINEKNLVLAQIKSMENVSAAITPGFEINVLQDICESTPQYVKENASLYQELGCECTVLSWNLLENTEKNIDALSNI